MTKEIEKEIVELYKLLHIGQSEDEKKERSLEFSSERNEDFFEKRWDSSFFANTIRY